MKLRWAVHLISAVLISHCFAGVTNGTTEVEKTKSRSKRAGAVTATYATAVIGAIFSAISTTVTGTKATPNYGFGPDGGCLWNEQEGCVSKEDGRCPQRTGFTLVEADEFTEIYGQVPSPADTRTNTECSYRKACFESDLWTIGGQLCSEGTRIYDYQLPLCCGGKTGNNLWTGTWEGQHIGTKYLCESVKCPSGRSECSDCGLQLKCRFKLQGSGWKTTHYDVVTNMFVNGRQECTALAGPKGGALSAGVEADAQFGRQGSIEWYDFDRCRSVACYLQRYIDPKPVDRWWKVQ